jgi:hypothetical protein
MRGYINKSRLTTTVAVFCILLPAGQGMAAEGQKLFDVDVNKQKAGLEKDFVQADEFLSQTKLQNVRSQVELLQHKLKKMSPDLSKEEAASYQSKIDNVITRIGAKEDSLIKVTMDVLHTRGVDAALSFLQNDLRQFGVSEKKTSTAEKTILDEAPKIQQAMERQAIDRAVKALQNNQPLEPNMDPYIVKTAERIIKAHTDSITAAENAKARHELEEKQRQERIQKEKEDKEKKIEEEKAAKIKQEEEKKKLVEQEIDRKKKDAEEKEKQRLARAEQDRLQKLTAQAEKARKDSLAVVQKEKERVARVEEEQRKQELTQHEKARKDSVAAVQRDSIAAAQQAQQAKELQNKVMEQQKERERLAKAEEEKRKQEIAKQEKVRRDSEAAAHKDSLAAMQKDSIAAAQKIAAQQAQQEKERQSKLSAQQKEQERLARAEQERQQKLEAKASVQAAAKAEKARKDSLAIAQKDSIAAAKKAEKASQAAQLAVQKQQPQKQETPQAQVRPKPEQPEQEKPPAISENAKLYLQGLRDNQKKAQDKVMVLYDLIDKKRAREALDKFKEDRAFIAQFVDAQVFNVLEQTIAQSVAASPPQTESAPAAAASSPEQQKLDKINSLMRDNKIEAAYAELKRSESTLRHFMTREDFRQLKEMVENAYKIRKAAK